MMFSVRPSEEAIQRYRPSGEWRADEWYWPTRVERVEALPRNQMGNGRGHGCVPGASETGLATAITA
jgi:hypothetical protein